MRLIAAAIAAVALLTVPAAAQAEREWAASGIWPGEADEAVYDAAQSGQIAPGPWPLTDWSRTQGLPPHCDAAITSWFEAELE